MKNLVIVESPAKAKTIEGYLGKDFVVKSSFGHVRDLPKGDSAVDIKNNFTPKYEVTSDKKEVVKDLKKLAKEADIVWLATDSDREGEAISWHLKEALGLDDKNTKRIVFREITKNAIQQAIQNPRTIDYDLVDAQQARRILDRLVGFELSPVLWKKVKAGLSAGRVQSVAVRLIVEREREVNQFSSQSSYKVSAIFDLEGGKKLKAELAKKIEKEADANTFLEKCKEAIFSIAKLETKPAKKTPAAPFTTSTLQQEASRKLGFSVSQTMTVAQRLYEAGHISYMRTDSTALSDDALNASKNEISKSFGAEYSKTRKYQTKNENAQEAHEAIRPTNFANHSVDADRNEQRLYELIWKRTVASQMADAELERTTATISISTVPEQLTATGEVVKFDGFLKLYLESNDDENEDEEQKGMLPPLKEGQKLNLNEMLATQTFSRPAARYTEASLVKKLEELGIGRPSTYAPTISTVQKRGYVVKENRDGTKREYRILKLSANKITSKTATENVGAEKSKLFPTDIANVVNDFLVAQFPNVIDFNFTAKVEKEFDEIALGQIKWNKMIEKFYTKFHKTVEDADNIQRAEVNTARLLGTDPKSGKNVYARLARFGPVIQIGESDAEQKPQYANLKKGQMMESISLDEALDLFQLPRESGIFNDKPMVVAVGRFGPYVKYDSKFYSLGKEDDPMTVTEARCIEIINAKNEADANKLIKEFNTEVKILNGKWGPYIAVGKKNVKIPKDKTPDQLTLEECLALAEATPEKKGRFAAKKK
jgi:DNA topoisomerase I